MWHRDTGILVLTVILLGCLLSAAVNAVEMRGVWVDAFHPGIMSQAQTTDMVAKAKDAGFNAVFVQVRKRADAYYTSKLEPRASDMQEGYDGLADVVEQAHKAGLQVHAWVSVLDVSQDSDAYKTKTDNVAVSHPDWLMKTKEGSATLQQKKIMLDPGVPEARKYTVSVITDIVSRYNVDGIHLDNVRYLGEKSGYNQTSQDAFGKQEEKAGIPNENDESWGDWRRAQLTQLVGEIYKSVKAAKPSVTVSAAVFGRRQIAHDYFMQDWEFWVKEGIVDVVIPMVFETNDNEYQNAVDDALASTDSAKVWIGQGAWRLPADQTTRQLEYARTKGASGVVVYSYDYTKRAGKDGKSTMDVLKAGVFAVPVSGTEEALAK